MSKSLGQIAGTVIGGAVGLAFPAVGFALGASVGGVVGGLIDPPKGPHTVGPRLDDLSFQSNTYGAPLPRFYGTVPIVGNVFWLEGDKYREVPTTTKSGGKGGSRATAETFKYYATFAVGFGIVLEAGQTATLRRMWVGTNLVYDASGASLDSTLASHIGTVKFTWYDGSDTQSPNPRMQADKGVANVSGYPGVCYGVIEDLDLSPYSNTLQMAQVKVEVVVGAIASPQIDQLEVISQPGASGVTTGSVLFGIPGAEYSRLQVDTWTSVPISASFFDLGFHEFAKQTASYAISGTNPAYSYKQVVCTSADEPIEVIAVVPPYPGDTVISFTLCTKGGQEGTNNFQATDVFNAGPHFCAWHEKTLFLANGGYSKPIHIISGNVVVATSPANYQSRAIGISQSYLFVLVYSASTISTTTIHRLDRSTLALVDTWTGAAINANASICVVSDTLVYTASDSHVYEWSSGVVRDLGALVSSTFSSGSSNSGFLSVATYDPVAVYWLSNNSANGHRFHIGHNAVSAIPAKLRDIVTAECALCRIDAGRLDLTTLTNSDVRGLRIASGPGRPVLEQLQAIFPFDATPSGYKLKFVSRGGASVATIPESDLGAVASGSEIPVLLLIAREMDSQIPATVRIKYLDPDREYDTGEQFASRPGTASVSERTVETGVVLTATEAARAADVLNQKDWLERRDFGPFSLPPSYGHLEAADVVTIQHRGTDYALRMTGVEYLPDGRLDCTGRLTAAQSYTSTATGVPPLVLGQSTVPLRGMTEAVLLDIPRMVSDQDVPGMSFALFGRASGWPGGIILRSDDSGGSWNNVGFSNEGAGVFVCSNALFQSSGYTADISGDLVVIPEVAGTELYSVTENQWYSQHNLAAYGDDGRWEIISFKNAVDNSGSFSLNSFLRGLYGTEWATGLHASGDRLIMLDTNSVSFFGMATNAIGVERLYKAVTLGADLESAVGVADTYDAINLKPLAPVDFICLRDESSNDLTFMWQRRSRWPVELLSGVDVPLGETAESYLLYVHGDSGFNTPVRSFLVSSDNKKIYSSADQVADFGVFPTTVYASIGQVSSVVGRGIAKKSQFSVPSFVDPYLASVVLLMHMNDTGCTDQKGHAITLNGNAARVSSSGDFGGYALGLDGSGDFASTPNASDLLILGGGDYTIEAFITLSAIPGTAYGAVIVALDYNNDGWQLRVDNGGGSLSLVYPGLIAYSISHTFTTNTRIHVTACRSGTTHYVGVNGFVTSASSSNRTTDYTGSLRVGAGNYPGAEGYFNGKIDELRITKGVARYTADYAVPTSAFQNP